jgi:4-hydroxyphenylpyruvate 3-dimethylallyltransferase
VPTTTRFLADIEATSAALGAPFSRATTEKCLDVFARGFTDGAIVWKTTEKPGGRLFYRFFARSSYDTIASALDNDLLAGETPATALARGWTVLFGEAATQSCDFDAAAGLAKTWIWLGGMHSATDVLDQGFVPHTLRRLLPTFHRAGLDYIRFAGVDHHSDQINLYFRARGPITDGQCATILGILDTAPPQTPLMDEMRRYLPQDFCVAITVSLSTGTPRRACFYALDVPQDRMQAIPARIAQFFNAAPSHDRQTVHVIGWSFGPNAGTYVKAEKSYSGDMASVLATCDCYFSGSSQNDPVLDKAGAL